MCPSAPPPSLPPAPPHIFSTFESSVISGPPCCYDNSLPGPHKKKDSLCFPLTSWYMYYTNASLLVNLNNFVYTYAYGAMCHDLHVCIHTHTHTHTPHHTHTTHHAHTHTHTFMSQEGTLPTYRGQPLKWTCGLGKYQV